MLQELLFHCKTRETFDNTGKRVFYRRTLLRALQDYEERGLDSWLMRYPLGGFCQIIRWHRMMNEPSSSSRIEALCKAKLMHLVISIAITLIVADKGWRFPCLGLIYRDFNAPCIPRDMGCAESIINAAEFWPKLLDIIRSRQDVNCFLLNCSDGFFDMIRPLQLAIFWAVFTQHEQYDLDAFFYMIAYTEPTSWMVLCKPTDLRRNVPENQVLDTLTSIFRSKSSGPDPSEVESSAPILSDLVSSKSGSGSTESSSTKSAESPEPSSAKPYSSASGSSCQQDVHSNEQILPFVSPFGSSVLHCGYQGCNVWFCNPNPIRESNNSIPDVDTVRRLRGQHLKDIFAQEGYNSTTGLPEPTTAPHPPTSSHCNLHRSMVRVWSRMDRSIVRKHSTRSLIRPLPAVRSDIPCRRAVYDDHEPAVDAFISAVMKEICITNGRGDIYQKDLRKKVKDLLPSFLEALRVASERFQLKSPIDYVHDWTMDTLEARIRYELDLRGPP